jgi:prepilin-type N-terminal cleavage/methylation domain-containing protein
MRSAYSLLELLVVCVIFGVIAGLAAPRIHAALDSMAAESAAREVVDALALGRLYALSRGSSDVRFDSSSVTVRSGIVVLYQRDVTQLHGVRLHANTPVVRFGATGLAIGLSNGTVVLTRGATTDSVIISRLGRVRR